MGVAVKNGHFKVSFSCLCTGKFIYKTCSEALAGLIIQVQELSVTLRVNKQLFFVIFLCSSAIEDGEAQKGHKNCFTFSMVHF